MLYRTDKQNDDIEHLDDARVIVNMSDKQNGGDLFQKQSCHFNQYCNHHQQRQNLSVDGLHNFCREHHLRNIQPEKHKVKECQSCASEGFGAMDKRCKSTSHNHTIRNSADKDSMYNFESSTARYCPLWTNEASRVEVKRSVFRDVSTFRSVSLFGLAFCLILFVGVCESRPASEAERKYRELRTNTVKYLAQFGYLRGPSREAPDLRSQEDLTRAIKALQKAGGIPQTGVPDSRTEALMTKPRCGNTDDFVDDVKTFGVGDDGGFKLRKKRYTVATLPWPRTNITFRFVNYTPDMPQAKTRELISEALSVWSKATPLSFTEVRDSSADIMIMFASQYHSDGYPFDGKGMVLGHAFFPGHGKGGDTHFDDDENWTTNSSDGVDLFMVAAHEFGHALGLAHSGNPNALMYPWYMGIDGEFQLPEDDMEGIISLYGTNEKDRYLPDKAKVSMIPNPNIPPVPDPTSDKDVDSPPDKGVDKNTPANPCTSRIDAITVFRTEIFLFIGKWFWRLDSRKVITKPIDIHQFWYGLPKHLEKIDAVFERPDNKILFFSGDRYWVFNANHLIYGFPPEGRPITEFNIPADVKNIDAAFEWSYNKRTYLVSGDMYWKMNENNTFVEYDYPRDMGTWKGVPVPLDAAFKDLDGDKDKTIFFQGLDFWEFNDMRMRVKPGFPKRISQHWLGCPGVAHSVEQRQESLQDNRDNNIDEDEEDDNDINNAYAVNQMSIFVVTVVYFMYAVCL